MIGSDSVSAFWKSSSIVSSAASPRWRRRTRRSRSRGSRAGGGGRREQRTGLVNRVIGLGRELVVDQGRAAVLGDEAGSVSGDSTLWVPGIASTRSTTSATTCRNRRRRRSSSRSRRRSPRLRSRFARDPRSRLGRLRLAVERLGAGQLPLADGAAREQGDDDERDPAQDCLLAVRRAPVSGPRRDSLALHFMPSFRVGFRMPRRFAPARAAFPWGRQVSSSAGRRRTRYGYPYVIRPPFAGQLTPWRGQC